MRRSDLRRHENRTNIDRKSLIKNFNSQGSSEPVGKIPALFPKCANGLLHCAFDSCGIGIIGRYCYRSMPASTDGIDDCVGPFRCARVSQRNVRTIARQSLRYGRANAAAFAGHECNSAFQVRHR
jgi:hypothetical protein